MSIEPFEQTKMELKESLSYEIPASVRVRKESFGLLFYDTEASRLTFVRSKDLLRVETLTNGKKRISAGVPPEAPAKVNKLLNHLLKKRLIRDS